MLKNLTDIQRGSLVGLFLFLATFSNYFFTTGSLVASCFCITIGFALGFYFYFKDKLLPYIFVGILLSNVLSRIIFIDETVWISIFISIGLSIVSILTIYIMRKVIVVFDIEDKINMKSSIVFISSTILVSALAGALITIMMILNVTEVGIYHIFIEWGSSFFFGILIFSVAILFSYYYDEKFDNSLGYNILGVLFIAMFILIASLLFSDTLSWFSYADYSYLFVLFFLILSFVFSFRMILMIDILFVILYQLFLIKLGNNTDYTYLILSINFYLLVLSSTASTVKMFLYELENRNKSLIESTKKLESLVYSTKSLLKLSDDILDTDVKIQEDYLTRIFKIACNIFDNYDYASCYIEEDPYVNFISAVGYDVGTLMSFNFRSDKIDFIDTENPMHVVNEDKSVRSSLEDKYDDFINIYPKMSESIRFGIYIDEETIGGISFDITKNSGKKFSKVQFDNLKSFQKLMNSFFSINYLNYKNISLKNDIVLSLIRTLELFDQYTGGHSEEVAYLSNEIAKRCKLDERETHDIYWAGVVHDIGKVGVDSSIINKPSKLSLDEYEQVKKHSIFGYDILNKAEDLKQIALLVKHHHEWWNGAGYPNGLKGDQIPFGSQIISVCDAVSTMAKKRPYTIVKTSREIIEELEMYIGVQFAPIPTKAMIEFIEEGFLDSFYKGR